MGKGGSSAPITIPDPEPIAPKTKVEAEKPDFRALELEKKRKSVKKTILASLDEDEQTLLGG